MKTKAPLPDEISEDAEQHERRIRKAGGQLDADAIPEYLARHAPREVTEAMNRVLGEVGETVDPLVVAASRQILERTDWQEVDQAWCDEAERRDREMGDDPAAGVPADEVFAQSSCPRGKLSATA